MPACGCAAPLAALRLPSAGLHPGACLAAAVKGCEDPNNSKWYLVVIQVGLFLFFCCALDYRSAGWSLLRATPPGCAARRCPPPHPALNLRFLAPALQYTARLNAEKLKKHIHRLSHGKIGTKFYNMRLAPEAVSGAPWPRWACLRRSRFQCSGLRAQAAGCPMRRRPHCRPGTPHVS